jgi:hypothetical protein
MEDMFIKELDKGAKHVAREALRSMDALKDEVSMIKQLGKTPSVNI